MLIGINESLTLGKNLYLEKGDKGIKKFLMNRLK